MLLKSEVDIALSHERALSFLDSTYVSLEAGGDSLAESAADIAKQHAALQEEVRIQCLSCIVCRL